MRAAKALESPDLEVIKLEFILRLKIKRNDWMRVRKQPIIALYFESEPYSSFITSRPELLLLNNAIGAKSMSNKVLHRVSFHMFPVQRVGIAFGYI